MEDLLVTKEHFVFSFNWNIFVIVDFLGPEAAAALILHSFRKPKRVRTAFTPSQLLKLENAFEKNHYVVGQERKELARHLNLTETQVSHQLEKRKC